MMQDDDGNWLLPDEIMENILKFVPEKYFVMLSCKKLYVLTCQLEKNHRVLRVNSDLVSELILTIFPRFQNSFF
jgi:hypothetical protein